LLDIFRSKQVASPTPADPNAMRDRTWAEWRRDSAKTVGDTADWASKSTWGGGAFRAFGGAALGAIGGAVLGRLTGNAGAGALAGLALGGLWGTKSAISNATANVVESDAKLAEADEKPVKDLEKKIEKEKTLSEEWEKETARRQAREDGFAPGPNPYDVKIERLKVELEAAEDTLKGKRLPAGSKDKK